MVGGLDEDVMRTGAAAYDPSTDRWRTLADAPWAPHSLNPLVAWTGTEMVILGGDLPEGSEAMLADFFGYAYRPDPGSWRTVTPPSGAAAFISARTPQAWTGQELLVWPERDEFGSTSATPLAYNPAGDAWRAVPSPPIAPRQQAASVWTGTEWIVWGGVAGGAELDDGAAYRPATGSWRVLARSPLSPRRVRAVWTGTEMIVAAGATGGDPTGNGEMALADGAAYDAAGDAWRPIAQGFAHPGFVPIWTGHEMLMFAKSGAVSYDPSRDRWSDSCCNETGGGLVATPVWNGSTALLMGSTKPEVGGAIFRPAS